jgi:hypothetical protein
MFKNWKKKSKGDETNFDWKKIENQIESLSLLLDEIN